MLYSKRLRRKGKAQKYHINIIIIMEPQKTQHLLNSQHFFLLQFCFPQLLKNTRHLYETSYNSAQYSGYHWLQMIELQPDASCTWDGMFFLKRDICLHLGSLERLKMKA